MSKDYPKDDSEALKRLTFFLFPTGTIPGISYFDSDGDIDIGETDPKLEEYLYDKFLAT